MAAILAVYISLFSNWLILGFGPDTHTYGIGFLLLPALYAGLKIMQIPPRRRQRIMRWSVIEWLVSSFFGWFTLPWWLVALALVVTISFEVLVNWLEADPQRAPRARATVKWLEADAKRYTYVFLIAVPFIVVVFYFVGGWVVGTLSAIAFALMLYGAYRGLEVYHWFRTLRRLPQRGEHHPLHLYYYTEGLNPWVWYYKGLPMYRDVIFGQRPAPVPKVADGEKAPPPPPPPLPGLWNMPAWLFRWPGRQRNIFNKVVIGLFAYLAAVLLIPLMPIAFVVVTWWFWGVFWPRIVGAEERAFTIEGEFSVTRVTVTRSGVKAKTLVGKLGDSIDAFEWQPTPPPIGGLTWCSLDPTRVVARGFDRLGRGDSFERMDFCFWDGARRKPRLVTVAETVKRNLDDPRFPLQPVEELFALEVV